MESRLSGVWFLGSLPRALVVDRGCADNLPGFWYTYAYLDGFHFVQSSNFTLDFLQISWVGTIWIKRFFYIQYQYVLGWSVTSAEYNLLSAFSVSKDCAKILLYFLNDKRSYWNLLLSYYGHMSICPIMSYYVLLYVLLCLNTYFALYQRVAMVF